MFVFVKEISMILKRQKSCQGCSDHPDTFHPVQCSLVSAELRIHMSQALVTIHMQVLQLQQRHSKINYSAMKKAKHITFTLD